MTKRMLFVSHVAAAIMILAWASSAMAMAASEPIKLAPHRAIYDMTLGEARSGSSAVAVSGRMVFEFTGSVCEGYTLNMRLVTQINDRSGQSTITDLRSTTWESADGKRFSFTTSQYLDEKTSETATGEASRAPDGAVTVKIKQPKASEMKIGKGVLFPTQHSNAVVAAAIEGRTLLQATVYDGSEKGEKVYDTTAFIGKTIPPGSGGELKDAANNRILSALPSWPITISYFDRGATGDSTPSYELTFVLYANGVSRDLGIDYGDFTLQGRLSSIEFLKAKPCR